MSKPAKLFFMTKTQVDDRDEEPKLRSATKEQDLCGWNIVGIDMSQQGHPLYQSALRRLRSRIGAPSSRSWQSIQLVEAERERQVAVEGFGDENDDRLRDGDLERAAAVYAMEGLECTLPGGITMVGLRSMWPFSGNWLKPADRVRNLTKACALLIAAMDRLRRRGT